MPNKTLVKMPSSQPRMAVTSTIRTTDCRLDPTTQLTSTLRRFARSSATITTKSATTSTPG